MGRGRNQRRMMEDEGGDETVSTVSTADSSEPLEYNEVVAEDHGDASSTDLDPALDLLYEKRSSTRGHGLHSLTKAFAHKVQLDFATRKGETILHQCLSIIKKGSASEFSLAVHAWGLLVISAGESELANMVFKESSPHLCRIAKQSLNAATRISALKSLAILTFVVGSEEGTSRMLSLLLKIGSYNMAENLDEVSGISEPTPEVRASALTSWAFLLSKVSGDWFELNHLEEVFPALLELLQMEDRSIRLSVGEGIIVIFESLSLDTSDLDYCEYLSRTLAGDCISGSAFEEVLTQAKDLSIEAGGKGASKKELSSQRKFFCDILAFIVAGTGPNISLRLSNSDSLSISTWAQSIQVNMFRWFLGGGFQAHMLANPFLQNVFDFKRKHTEKLVLSTKQKRMFLSPNSASSKARTQELNRRRSNTQARNYGHYSINAEDRLL